MLNLLGIAEVDKIYEIVAKTQKEININDKITHDASYKIQMK